MTDATGDAWAPRQADYYGMAKWLLEFLHRDDPTDEEGRRRWGLTRAGKEYVKLHGGGDHEAARRQLRDAIRGVELVARIRTVVREAGRVGRSRVDEVVAVSTRSSRGRQD